MNVRAPIPALRRDLEVQPRRDGTVDVRDPFLLQIYTLDAEDFALAQHFDGRRDVRALLERLKKKQLAVTAQRIRSVAKDFDEISLLDTPAVWKKKPEVENTTPHSQLISTERRPSQLPVFQEEARWSCHACGACCHGLVVEISREEESRIDAKLYPDLLGAEHFAEDAFIDPDQPAKRVLRQRREAGAACIFLMPDGLCAVHARQGMESKPDACQIFPHMLLQLPQQPPRLGMRVNCASMHQSFEDGASVGEAIPHVLRILETSPSHRIGRTLEWFKREVPVSEVDAIFGAVLKLLEERPLDAETLALIDRRYAGGRVARARRAFGTSMLEYLRAEASAEIPVDEGALVEQVKKVERGRDALAAMRAGRAVPRVPARVERFLKKQLGHVLYVFGPANLPDAGFGFVSLLLLLEAVLHAVGPRGRLKTANTAFLVFTGPLLETTTHAWPVLEAIDGRYAQKLKKELASEG